eukprot:snap_masked-scaffold_46-processed-gene-1.85-mRNA-1 protein AED:1.00 eAED:1.00 QI:0/-1/0/0/-1/1/1/0/80
MRKISGVLEPCDLWLDKAIQWNDDAMLVTDNIDDIYSMLECYLKRIQKMKSRLSTEKCVLLATGEEFYGGKTSSKGHGFC